MGLHVVEQAGGETREREGREPAGGEAAERHAQALPEHEAEHVARVGADRHADPDLLAPLADEVREQPVDPDGGEQQRQQREGREQSAREPRGGDRCALHRP